jgi:hypothetical protein
MERREREERKKMGGGECYCGNNKEIKDIEKWQGGGVGWCNHPVQTGRKLVITCSYNRFQTKTVTTSRLFKFAAICNIKSRLHGHISEFII